jgi:hypothetical protein
MERCAPVCRRKAMKSGGEMLQMGKHNRQLQIPITVH